MMKVKPKRRLTLEGKKAIIGYIFISPFLIGLAVFFVYPLVQSIIFSFNDLEVTTTGYKLNYVGLGNYRRAFLVDPNFRRVVVEAVTQMITDVPLIVIFSFFAATLLNQEFKGRALARAIFFLPVILTSGVIIAIENSDMLISMARSSFEEEATTGAVASVVQALELRRLLMQSRMDPRFIGYITGAIDNIYEVITASGVQILVFLAGLQTISPSLYEAAIVEGATGWEKFWKITFPMISPLILVNVVYSIIDSFTRPTNQVMQMIMDAAFKESSYGYSSAIAWVYFVTVMLILGVAVGIISKRVFYQE
ncbi:carbohydrate ABC transporter permease [Caldicoprobacter faecalis]|nr:sugar ABC transporter permease [Caldicoprobacter faecalis]